MPKNQINWSNIDQVVTLCAIYGTLISSPHCTVSGFVYISVLNLLICYTSVILYMKWLSPPLRVVTFMNAR